MIHAAMQALVSHWRRQPVQFATLVIGLALATGLWSAVQAINAQARSSYAKAAQQLGATGFDVLTLPGGMIELETYIRLRRAGWQVTPVLEGRTRIGSSVVSVVGIDFLNYPLPPVPTKGQSEISPQEILSSPGRLFAAVDTGKKITEPPYASLIVVSDQVPPGIVMTGMALAEDLLGRTGQISRLIVLPNQNNGLPSLSDVAPQLTLSDRQSSTDISRLTDSFHLNLTAFGLLSFAVGLFIVHGTIGLAFEQRRAMFRTMRALGLPVRTLSWLLLGELIVLALVAGSFGLLIGYLIAAALLPDVSATLQGLYGAPVDGVLTLRPIWFVGGLGMALAGSLLAGAHGLWRLRSMHVLAAPGVRSWMNASARQSRLLALGGVSLISAGMLCLLFFDGLLAGFALLAGVMLGAALLLPPALEAIIIWAGRKSKNVVTQWLWADLRAQLPGLSLALMALMLALAANIGVGTMVSSFRLTFTSWLDQRLAAELYVTAESDEQGEEIKKWLSGRAEAVLPIRYVQTNIAGQPVRVYGINDHATYRDNWPVIDALPDVWTKLFQDNSVLINEQFARRANVWSGDIVTLAPNWTVRIVGVYSDYGNPTGQVILRMPDLLHHFDNVPNRQFGVRVPNTETIPLGKKLRERFDLPVTGILDQSVIKERSLRVFEKTFVVTSALNILTLGVASFAILTSFLTLWTVRLPQLAPVWALGMTRKQLARLEVLRSVALAVMTALLALPLGLVLAWVLLAIINVEAFGWRLPMYLFPSDWVRLGILALLSGAIAAALPARRLRKTPPADLLKVFANER